jgi:hypothetical protein
MITKLLALNVILVALVPMPVAQTSQKGEERTAREVRHELVMLPDYEDILPPSCAPSC